MLRAQPQARRHVPEDRVHRPGRRGEGRPDQHRRTHDAGPRIPVRLHRRRDRLLPRPGRQAADRGGVLRQGPAVRLHGGHEGPARGRAGRRQTPDRGRRLRAPGQPGHTGPVRDAVRRRDPVRPGGRLPAGLQGHLDRRERGLSVRHRPDVRHQAAGAPRAARRPAPTSSDRPQPRSSALPCSRPCPAPGLSPGPGRGLSLGLDPRVDQGPRPRLRLWPRPVGPSRPLRSCGRSRRPRPRGRPPRGPGCRRRRRTSRASGRPW
ncbi:hypothetical protein CLV70_109205 [Pseudosporangium ferrugineum]|uniref:Uncharacterized protein n=1 Tax=Pseudosporangium ferrugineum TaxID=439699 RepID=A0A2T0S3R5_9ACTN|nr:hypothetical protein CLV70_109205 [Pseudosporangium ferrugineum]